MSVIYKYIGFGLMFVFLGILGVGVFLFYIMKNINYLLNNPLDTKKAPMHELNLKKPWKNPKISRNSVAKFRLI
jgi:hypothetical protein